MNEKLQEEIDNIIERIREIKFEKRDLEHKLVDIVMSYKGSVQEALEDGLVRLNFPAPPGYYKFLRSDKTREDNYAKKI